MSEQREATRPKFLSSWEPADLEAYTRVEEAAEREWRGQLAKNMTVSVNDVTRLLRLAKIGMQAERLYNSLKPRMS